MAKKFSNLRGLTTLLNQLVRVFAPATEVTAIENDTKNYVTEIDYDTELGFDTTESYENIPITEEDA